MGAHVRLSARAFSASIAGMILTHGNAAKDGAHARSWFVGDLANWLGGGAAATDPRTFGLRQSAAVEMKWGVHRAGDTRPDWAECVEKLTMSLLIRGGFLLQFRSPVARNHITERRLQHEGDYVIWGANLEHTWVVEQDSVILTIRWKAAP
jgi:hypothetical protein